MKTMAKTHQVITQSPTDQSEPIIMAFLTSRVTLRAPELALPVVHPAGFTNYFPNKAKAHEF